MNIFIELVIIMLWDTTALTATDSLFRDSIFVSLRIHSFPWRRVPYRWIVFEINHQWTRITGAVWRRRRRSITVWNFAGSSSGAPTYTSRRSCFVAIATVVFRCSSVGSNIMCSMKKIDNGKGSTIFDVFEVRYMVVIVVRNVSNCAKLFF